MAAGDTPPASGEVLSPTEVETLLTQLPTQEPTPAAAADDAPRARAGPAAELVSTPFDFRQRSFLTPVDLRKLGPRHEEFARALAARLSLYLRIEVSATVVSLEVVPYDKFTRGLASPTHLSLFKAEPLRGIGLLNIPVKLGLTMVDRLLGGPAQGISSDHGLSEIELALLSQAVQLVASEWCDHWSANETLKAVILGHEQTGNYLQTSPRDCLLLVITLEVKVGDCTEQLQVAVPSETLEPIIRHLALVAATISRPPPSAEIALRWNHGFDDVRVPIVAFWENIEMTARELANLQVGTVLPLERHCADRVRLRLANLPKFEGRLGTTGGKWAVAITGVLKADL